MDTLAAQLVRPRGGVRTEKSPNKGRIGDLCPQIALHELGMPSSKWLERQLTPRLNCHLHDKN